MMEYTRCNHCDQLTIAIMAGFMEWLMGGNNFMYLLIVVVIVVIVTLYMTGYWGKKEGADNIRELIPVNVATPKNVATVTGTYMS